MSLGFQKFEAPLLYEHKEQWIGVHLDTKIKCPERGCKFETEMYPDCFVEHCKTVHGWRDYPCTYENCSWVSHSSTNYKQHKIKFHEGLSSKNLAFKCSFTDCGSSFNGRAKLELHMNVHNNIGLACAFCPYRNTLKTNFQAHLNNHFGHKPFKCNFCESSFATKGYLTEHIENIHDAVKYNCPLCDQTGTLQVMRTHLNTKHKVKSTFDREKKQFFVVKHHSV